MEIITSRENKLIKEYGKLSSQKAYRSKMGLFCIEGQNLVQEALQNGVSFHTIFVTEDFLAKGTLASEKLEEAARTILITNEIAKKISDTNTPQGIFAICFILDKSLSIATIEKEGKYILLADLQDSGNVGTILRSAEAFGINGVIITKNTCDIYNQKVLRSTTGSIFRMPIMICEDMQSLIAHLKEKGVVCYASVVRNADEALPQACFAPHCVVLIGNEGNGLSEEQIAACSKTITIQMNGRAESLNASMAAAVIMWEMTK